MWGDEIGEIKDISCQELLPLLNKLENTEIKGECLEPEERKNAMLYWFNNGNNGLFILINKDDK